MGYASMVLFTCQDTVLGDIHSNDGAVRVNCRRDRWLQGGVGVKSQTANQDPPSQIRGLMG